MRYFRDKSERKRRENVSLVIMTNKQTAQWNQTENKDKKRMILHISKID